MYTDIPAAIFVINRRSKLWLQWGKLHPTSASGNFNQCPRRKAWNI